MSRLFIIRNEKDEWEKKGMKDLERKIDEEGIE